MCEVESVKRCYIFVPAIDRTSGHLRDIEAAYAEKVGAGCTEYCTVRYKGADIN
jgi:hypothetical protein